MTNKEHLDLNYHASYPCHTCFTRHNKTARGNKREGVIQTETYRSADWPAGRKLTELAGNEDGTAEGFYTSEFQRREKPEMEIKTCKLNKAVLLSHTFPAVTTT